MHEHFDVVIVGGGVAGNACALALAQCGFRVALLSNETSIPMGAQLDARVYALSHSSVDLLKDLCVWDAIDSSRTCAVTDMRIMGDLAHGEMQQGVLNFSAYSAHQSELTWIVEQNNIQTALQQAIRFSPNITLIKSLATGFKLNDHQVELTTATQTISADLMIGCDGANSWVRTQSKIGTDVFDYAQHGVVAHFACALPHNGCAHQWFLPDGEILALLPLPNQQVSMVYSCTAEHATGLSNMSLHQLSEHITQLSHQTLGELQALSDALSFPLKRMIAHHFIAERTLLLGDAAHTVHPLAGQGLNLGLQDVACLRRLMMQRESFRTISDRVVLRRYERERVAATRQMQLITHGLNRIFSQPHSAFKNMRNLGMNILDITPPLKRWLIQNAIGTTHPKP